MLGYLPRYLQYVHNTRTCVKCEGSQSQRECIVINCASTSPQTRSGDTHVHYPTCNSCRLCRKLYRYGQSEHDARINLAKEIPLQVIYDPLYSPYTVHAQMQDNNSLKAYAETLNLPRYFLDVYCTVTQQRICNSPCVAAGTRLHTCLHCSANGATDAAAEPAAGLSSFRSALSIFSSG